MLSGTFHASGTTVRDPATATASAPTTYQPNEELGRRRAAAATMFMLGLPGGAYLYQGEELGLPDSSSIPGSHAPGPHVRPHRRSPHRPRRLPGAAALARRRAATPASATAWILGCRSPSPGPHWRGTSRSPIRRRTLTFTGRMLAERAALRLGQGSLAWVEDYCSDSSLAYLNGNTLVIMNVGAEAMPLPAGDNHPAKLRGADARR